MLFGAHISAAGGLWNAPANSAVIGGECFQFFSRPPQGGKAMPLSNTAIEQFHNAMQRYKQRAAYIHAPYCINLASTNNRIRYGSISVLREELERGSALGAKAMMTHMGSANDLLKSGMSRAKVVKEGLKMVIEGIQKILDGYTGSCQFLIEIAAGAGLVIGDTFEEVATILKAVDKKLQATSYKLTPRVGVCFDTQHAFASGYDLRENSTILSSRAKQSGVKRSLVAHAPCDDKTAGVDAVLRAFDNIIGIDRLVVIHCNDSLTELGSHKDRHADLGDGLMGLETFRALVKSKKFRDTNLILETPTDEKRTRDINVLKGFRGKRLT